MESRNSDQEPGRRLQEPGTLAPAPEPLAAESPVLDSETERVARSRLFDEVLAAVELVLAADGVAFWREESDHSLVLTASRSIQREVLDALDKNVMIPLQSIMQRWPDSPLVAIPLDDSANPIADEIRAVAEKHEIVGLAGVPCRVPGAMLGLLVVVHRRPHPWSVRELGLATGFAGQLATAMQNSRLYASVRSLASRLTAIHELSLRLAQLRDVESIADAIVAEVGRLVDCDTVRVYCLDPAEGHFKPIAASGTFVGIASPPMEALSTGYAETLPGWVAKRNEAVIVPDASMERRSIFRSTFGPESVLLVPMAYGDEVHGVLVVSKSGANHYGPDDEQALAIFGRYAGQAFVNAGNIARLEAQQTTLERQLAGERRLLAISEQLVSTLEPRQVLEQIADTIGSVVHFDFLTIYRHDRETGSIEPVLSRVRSGEAVAPDAGKPALDEGLTSWVIGRGDAVCANDVAEGDLAGDVAALGGGLIEPGSPDAVAPTEPDAPTELDAATEPDSTPVRGWARGRLAHSESIAGSGAAGRISHNIIVVPLRVHGEVVGSLNLTRIGGREAHFSEPEFELGKLFAGQASIALQNAEAHVTVSTRADLDALTQLRNHGTFQRDLQALTDAGEPFSLLMMDLDSFKAFNDTYGHPAGDALLKTVAQAIVGATRQDDRAYRYGGDEFALLLVGPSSSHASEVAGRIRVAVREAVRFSPITGGVPFGASVGVAHWPAEGPGKSELVRAADAALYEAKRSRGEASGRGRTEAQHGDAGVGGLLDAARDFLSAGTLDHIARALVLHATATLDSADGVVALIRDGGFGPMTRVAGTGRFAGQDGPIVRGEGLMGRIWVQGGVEIADTGEGALVGVAISVDGTVAGVLAVGVATQAVLPHHLKMLDHLTALAAAAMRRLDRPAGAGSQVAGRPH
jgi:diguanylate cyclase (GGDEF)-like protein